MGRGADKFPFHPPEKLADSTRAELAVCAAQSATERTASRNCQPYSVVKEPLPHSRWGVHLQRETKNPALSAGPVRQSEWRIRSRLNVFLSRIRNQPRCNLCGRQLLTSPSGAGGQSGSIPLSPVPSSPLSTFCALKPVEYLRPVESHLPLTLIRTRGIGRGRRERSLIMRAQAARPSLASPDWRESGLWGRL